MDIINKIKSAISSLLFLTNEVKSAPYIEKIITLESLNLAVLNRKKDYINSLSDVEFCGFSQWGEDGIIDWLVEKLPRVPKTFVEFGVGDYLESNTRLLLFLRNWKGLVFDGSHEHVTSIRDQDIYWRYDITAIQAFITKDNINKLISDNGFSGEIGILSIDIDGNDYWVWDAIDVVKPYIIICEYNSVLGDLQSITVPYDESFYRTNKHYSNLYFGASIKSLINLAEQKGYTFVGTCSNGCNAFFVHTEKASNVINGIEQHKAYSSKVRESRGINAELTFLSGSDRINEIKNMQVYDTEENSIKIISEYEELYSQDWLSKY